MPGLDKSQRLLSKKDFDSTLDGSGLKIVCRDFVLVASKVDVSHPARLGLIVSGKVGNSVVRNRIKRSIREVFRSSLALAPQLAGRDLVVIARPSLVDDQGRVKDDVQDSLRHCSSRLLKKLVELK
jgi:ribonuclease P protein component